MACSKIARMKKLGISVAAGGAAILGTPALISAAGFGAGGIVAGTVAAKLMALTTSYGVGTCVVGTLQSIGAVGALSTAQAAITGASVSGTTYLGLKLKDRNRKKDEGKDKKDEPNPKS